MRVDLFKAMEISASGLRAQRTRVEAISTNLANVNTTRTEEGGPYRRREVVFTSAPTQTPFSDLLATSLVEQPPGVSAEVVEGSGEMREVYDPSHPDADEKGFVRLPNVNLVEEMVDLLSALRDYEANVTAFNAAKSMVLKALEIGK